MEKKIVKLSPRDNSILYEMVCDDVDRIKDVVAKTSNAFKVWAEYPVQKRIEIVNQFVLAMETNKESIVQVIIEETGKPYIEAETEIIEAIDICNFYINQQYECFDYTNSYIDSSIWENKVLETIRQPLGVVAVIKPWNYPFELCIWAIIPVLIAGNAVILKPSELSSKVGKIVVDLFNETNIPENTISIVIGDGETAEILLENNQVSGVCFTGSSKVGLSIATQLSNRFIPLSLEMGGKDYAIVYNDADIDLTVKGLLWGCFTNAGQVCVSTENILVHRDVYDEFMDKFVKVTQDLILDRDVGPVITKEKLVDILEIIESAKKDGVNVVCGGTKCDDPKRQNGNYLFPTIMVADKKIHNIDEVELFAPVVVVRCFNDESEIAEICNSSKFGLGCSIWTKNSERGSHLLKTLDIGMLWVNEVNLPMPSIPWTGSKKSALGFSLSKESVYAMTKIKTLHTDTNNTARQWWYPYE